MTACGELLNCLQYLLYCYWDLRLPLHILEALIVLAATITVGLVNTTATEEAATAVGIAMAAAAMAVQHHSRPVRMSQEAGLISHL